MQRVHQDRLTQLENKYNDLLEDQRSQNAAEVKSLQDNFNSTLTDERKQNAAEVSRMQA
jgi:hypothetical protein